MEKAILLLSGGLDSTVAAWLLRPKIEPALAITVDYGQRALPREAAAAYALSRRLEIPHRVLSLPFLREACRNPLTDPKAAMPTLSRSELDDSTGAAQRSAHSVWVPNRNFSLIAVAATWAEVNDAPYVVCGFNKEEAATFPDNSEEFLARVNGALEFSTRNRVRVIAPTAHMRKTDIVKAGLAAGAPLELCWSCYLGLDLPCRTCESCQRFQRACEEAGIADQAQTWFQNKRRLP